MLGQMIECQPIDIKYISVIFNLKRKSTQIMEDM